MIHGGRTVYGFMLGVIMLDTKFPRIKGDIGNADTWDFPVVYKKVEGIGAKEILLANRQVFNKFLQTAFELENQGVTAITTSCGLTILFQRELVQALHVPIFTSSVLILPLLRQILGYGRKICILTASARVLTKEVLKQVNIDDQMVTIREIDGEEFKSVFLYNKEEMDLIKVANEVAETARISKEQEDIEAFILECTNLAPFAGIIQAATNVPVFDIRDLVRFVRSGFIKYYETSLQRW